MSLSSTKLQTRRRWTSLTSIPCTMSQDRRATCGKQLLTKSCSKSPFLSHCQESCLHSVRLGCSPLLHAALYQLACSERSHFQEQKMLTYSAKRWILKPPQQPCATCRDAGAVSAINYHIILRLNGEFYGLYTYTENDDNDYLQVGAQRPCSRWQVADTVF